ncbi:MAG: biotin carboxylase N-terminal domain-containing protein [Acidimicrobiales bacterium]
MALQKLLVANRGEIAIRIMRAASDLGIATVAVHPADDAASLHTRVADETRLLDGRGAAAYLAIDNVVQAALDAGCDAVHPGYGFLAENPAFAAAVEAAGLTFVGLTPRCCSCSATRWPPGTWPAAAGCRCWPAPTAPPTSRPPPRSSTAWARALR